MPRAIGVHQALCKRSESSYTRTGNQTLPASGCGHAQVHHNTVPLSGSTAGTGNSLNFRLKFSSATLLQHSARLA